jgi:hypothetical protein
MGPTIEQMPVEYFSRVLVTKELLVTNILTCVFEEKFYIESPEDDFFYIFLHLRTLCFQPAGNNYLSDKRN